MGLQLISSILEAELSYINVAHPDFASMDFLQLLIPPETTTAAHESKGATPPPEHESKGGVGGFFSSLFGSSTPRSEKEPEKPNKRVGISQQMPNVSKKMCAGRTFF